MFITVKGHEINISSIRIFRKVYDESDQLTHYALEFLGGESFQVDVNDVCLEEAVLSGEFGHTKYGLFNLGNISKVYEMEYIRRGVDLGITRIDFVYPEESFIQFIGDEQEKVAGLKELMDNYLDGAHSDSVGIIPGSIFEIVGSEQTPDNCLRLDGAAITAEQLANNKIPATIRAHSHLPDTRTRFLLGDGSLTFIEMVKVLYLGK